MNVRTYLTSASVKTGLVGTLVGDPRLAVLAGVSRRAGTRVRALARVAARRAVFARSVISAIVEVEVAEEAAPALVAYAFVGLVTAGTVLAARVPHALVAKAAGPTGFASENKENAF